MKKKLKKRKNQKHIKNTKKCKKKEKKNDYLVQNQFKNTINIDVNCKYFQPTES